jgi:hypothetical protein
VKMGIEVCALISSRGSWARGLGRGEGEGEDDRVRGRDREVFPWESCCCHLEVTSQKVRYVR